jgi:hypothetical protein
MHMSSLADEPAVAYSTLMSPCPTHAVRRAVLLVSALAALVPVRIPAVAPATTPASSPGDHAAGNVVAGSREAGVDAAAKIRADTERLQRAAKDDTAAGPSWKSVRPDFERSLARAQQALRAGRLWLSLEELGQARNLFCVFENRPRRPEEGLASFESAWKRTGVELVAFDNKARERVWTKALVAIRAMSEASQGKAMPLLEASRPYAYEMGEVESGFYYLGAAREAAEFATFCHSLELPRQTAALPLRSVSPELRRLQALTAAAFQPPRSIELHAKFIRLNATLKLAGELDAARLYAGALYKYLDAVQQFGTLEPAAPAAANSAKQSGLRRVIAALHAQLTASKQDASIAELFVQRAEALVAPDRLPAPSQDDLGNARVIVEQVLPSYFAFVRAAPTVERPLPNAVSVTLVRWPYT